MKNVLCFGDSNTYGYDPAGMRDGTAVRYAHDVRWCGVAQRDLGEGWHVIEEGLNGRTTVRDDMCHLDTNLNGIRALPMLLEAHKPLDAIVIMLGTNDCKTVFNVTASDIARGAMALIRAVPLGAKMHEFAGYNMPIEYSGIIDEHLTVCQGVGVFDVSHMGEFWVKGPHALDFLQTCCIPLCSW